MFGRPHRKNPPLLSAIEKHLFDCGRLLRTNPNWEISSFLRND